MPVKAELMPTDMSHWASGTRHYRVGSKDYAVEATLEEGNVIPAGTEPYVGELLQVIGEGRAPLLTVMRPTVVFACTPEGEPIDLTPVRIFPAGLPHEDAIAEMTR